MADSSTAGESPAGEGHVDPAVLVGELAIGGDRLRALPATRRLGAWRAAVTRLLDPMSSVRRALDGPLGDAVRLSPGGLDAGLRAIASGMLGRSAEELFRDAAARPAAGPREPALVVLASNLPGLALQTVLPALARGRPLIVRSSGREPCFAPALLRELAAAEPELGHAFAALTWSHGDPLASALLARCDPVLAYGGGEALAALRAQTAGRLVEYGPKLSFGVVGEDATDQEVERLARDVALFDQRGCLSVQAVLSRAPVRRVAALLARGLDRQAERIAPGPATPEESAAFRRELDLTRLRGGEVFAPRPGAGAVALEPTAARIEPSPGRRLVRRHPIASADELVRLLAPLAGALQGAALAGADRDELAPRLRALGVSRIAAAGCLQETDARWQNGGVDPLEVL